MTESTRDEKGIERCPHTRMISHYYGALTTNQSYDFYKRHLGWCQPCKNALARFHDETLLLDKKILEADRAAWPVEDVERLKEEIEELFKEKERVVNGGPSFLRPVRNFYRQLLSITKEITLHLKDGFTIFWLAIALILTVIAILHLI